MFDHKKNFEKRMERALRRGFAITVAKAVNEHNKSVYVAFVSWRTNPNSEPITIERRSDSCSSLLESLLYLTETAYEQFSKGKEVCS